MDLPDLQIVQTLHYLLPGFVAAWVFYGLTAHPKKTPFERAVQALIFTAFIQPITLAIRELLYLIGSNPDLQFGIWTSNVYFSLSTFVGLGLGIVMSICANKNFPHGKLPDWITKRTSSPSEWHSIFNQEKRWVYLHLKGGRRLYGWPFEWPDHPDVGHFVIVDPVWILDDNTRAPMYMTSHFLVPASEVEMVEFELWDNEIEYSKENMAEIESKLVNLQKDEGDDSIDHSHTLAGTISVNGSESRKVRCDAPSKPKSKRKKRRRKNKNKNSDD